MHLIARFIAAGAMSQFAMTAEAQTIPPSFPPLTLEEQETLRTYHARKQCVDEQTPITAREQRQYEELNAIRDNYIRTRAAELARQRNDASMHIILSGALSENLSKEDTDELVRALRDSDEIVLRTELDKMVKKNTPPADPADTCAIKLNIDVNNFGRRVRTLTEKHGMNILQMPEVR